MSRFLTTLLLFGLAFVVLPFGTSWYEIPKVLIAIAFVIYLSIYFFSNGSHWKDTSVTRPRLVLYGAFFVLTVGGLVLQRSTTTYFGNAFRMQGVFLFWMLMLWSMFSPVWTNWKKLHLIAFATLFATVIFALTGIHDQAGRAVGTLGEANSLGAFAVFLFPLTLISLSPKKGKVLPVLAWIMTLLVIFFSGSRSSLIGFFIATLFVVIPNRVELRGKIIIVTVLVCASLLLPFIEPKQDFDYRKEVWRTALEAGKERPLFGWGVGNTEIGLLHAAKTIQTFPRFQYVDSSHNVFLDWWVQGGIVGLALFSLLILQTIRGFIKQHDTVHLASFFAILTVMLFNPVSSAILIPFWWLIGESTKKNRKGSYE